MHLLRTETGTKNKQKRVKLQKERRNTKGMDLPPIGAAVDIVGGRFERYGRGVVHSYTPKMVYLEIPDADWGPRLTKKEFIRPLTTNGDREETGQEGGGQVTREGGSRGREQRRHMMREIEALRLEVRRLSLAVERLGDQ